MQAATYLRWAPTGLWQPWLDSVQVQKIRLLLRARGLGNIRVGTVDDLQGQEERIIFISTVLSKPETLPAVSSDLGFWRNPKRFNVAITRAKALLVVLGHPVLLLEVPLLPAPPGPCSGFLSCCLPQELRSK